MLAEERRSKREVLLKETEQQLRKIEQSVARRTKHPMDRVEIARKVGRVINRWKMAKHFKVEISDGKIGFIRNEESIRRESEMDGIYVIRTPEPAERLSSDDVVRSYKRLTEVEEVFRTIKGVDLMVRPIRHWLETRVRAHIMICVLAYYVEWYMRKSLAPMLFSDEELEHNRLVRDPVVQAKPSRSAKRKKAKKASDDGSPLATFREVISDLGTRCRNLCQLRSDPSTPLISRMTEPTVSQQKVYDHLGLFPVL
jgi:transposase